MEILLGVRVGVYGV